MIGWLAHNDDNKVCVLYSGQFDAPKTQERELTKLLRRGYTIREITDEDGARRAWGHAISEKAMNALAAAPVYDPDGGSATQLAAQIVASASTSIRQSEEA